MIIKHPSLELFLESGSIQAEAIGKWHLEPYIHGHEKTHHVEMNRSFGAIRILVDDAAHKDTHIIIDGQEVAATKLGNTTSTKLALEYDLEFHRISVIVKPWLSVTIDLSVEHHHAIKRKSGSTLSPKWRWQNYISELTALKAFFHRKTQNLVIPNRDDYGFSAGEARKPPPLIQVLIRFSAFIKGLSPSDLSNDFSTYTMGGISRDKVIQEVRENPMCVQMHPNGVIAYKGNRYTTSMPARDEARGANIDLSPIRDSLELCREILRRERASGVAIYMISELIRDIEPDCAREHRANEALAILDQQMRSHAGLAIQDYCRLLLSMTRNKATASGSNDIGLFWLRTGIRDFDVFQAAAFYLCARACELSNTDIFDNPAGPLEKNGYVVIDPNTESGLSTLKKSLSGWRSGSIQPSDYRPDVFILTPSGKPILIDAKFRISSNELYPASSSAIKELQAYLDEFGLAGAIIIAPLPHAGGTETPLPTLDRIQGFDRLGRKRIIAVVSISGSGDLAAIEKTKEAISLIDQLPL